MQQEQEFLKYFCDPTDGIFRYDEESGEVTGFNLTLFSEEGKRYPFSVYRAKVRTLLSDAIFLQKIMTRQCINHRRIGDIDPLRIQIGAWANITNDKQRGVDWQFTIADARTKLKPLYPEIKI